MRFAEPLRTKVSVETQCPYCREWTRMKGLRPERESDEDHRCAGCGAEISLNLAHLAEYVRQEAV